MMEAWTSKPGYPVVSVETREEGDKTVLCLSQERFYMDGRKDEEGCLWKVTFIDNFMKAIFFNFIFYI